MVPEGWRRVEIGEAGAVVTGSTPSTNNPAFYEGGNVPFVSPADLGGGTDILDAGKVITEEGLAQVRGVPKGSTLFVCIGSTIGKIGFATRDLATNQQINSVVPFAENDPRFVFYAIALRARHIARLAGNQAVPIINKSQFSGEMIDLPPLAEQKRIAEVLGVWDRAIEVAGKQLDLARTQKRALMQTLLTPTRRFPGYEGQPWKEVRLGDVAEIKIGGTPSRAEPAYWAQGDEGHTWLSIADLGPKMLNRSKETITDEGIRRSNVKLVPAGTVVMSFKLTIGKLGIAAVPLYTNEAICAITPNSDDSFEPRFLFHLLQVTDLLGDVDQAVKGKTLNKAKLSELVIKLPDISEQRYVAQFLDEQDELVDAHETQIARLQAEKKALMQQLLTGQKRLAV